MIELEPALRSLTEHEVNFVIVGGVAITAHGSAYITQDLVFCYDRSSPNLVRLARSLTIKIISLDELIQSKIAAGRPKDLLVLPELETLREIRDNPEIEK